MFEILHKRNNIKILGVEINEAGNRYVLVEYGRDVKVLYKGMELPAFAFDGVALAIKKIAEYSLPIRNVSDKEMLALLHNEMQVSWGLNPDEHRVAWCRPKDNHDVMVGIWDKMSYDDTLDMALSLSKEVLALTPVRKNGTREEDVYAAALHAVMVACGKAKDLNFALLLHNTKKEQLLSRRYLLATKGIIIFAGVVFAGLTFLYGFSSYKVYTLNKILKGMSRIQEQYDWYLLKSGQINLLQRMKTKILDSNKFRTEQVEQILDAMPDYNNEITFLRTREMRENNKQFSGIILEGWVGEIKQLKKFVENLNRIKRFSGVNIGTGKNIGNEEIDYVINIIYGECADER